MYLNYTRWGGIIGLRLKMASVKFTNGILAIDWFYLQKFYRKL